MCPTKQNILGLFPGQIPSRQPTDGVRALTEAQWTHALLIILSWFSSWLSLALVARFFTANSYMKPACVKLHNNEAHRKRHIHGRRIIFLRRRRGLFQHLLNWFHLLEPSFLRQPIDFKQHVTGRCRWRLWKQRATLEIYETEHTIHHLEPLKKN